jgi:UDP-glucose 4-epimerase
LRVLITGAGGFVGSHLVKALVQDDRTEVIGIARKPSGLFFPRYRELALDLSTPDFPDRLPPGIDVVVHLAQSLGYRDFPSTADDLFAVNVGSTARLLEWGRTRQIKRFLFASSGNVYTPSALPLKETDPCDPNSFYGVTKLSAELLIRQYSSFFDTTVLRIFGVYGPKQRGMLIPNMIARIRSGGDVTLGQGIGYVFSPLFITDCVEILAGLTTQTDTRGSDVYNLGGTETVDLKRVVDLLGRHVGKSPKITNTDAEVTYLLGDSSKLYSKAGFRPRVGIERGLELTVQALD